MHRSGALSCLCGIEMQIQNVDRSFRHGSKRATQHNEPKVCKGVQQAAMLMLLQFMHRAHRPHTIAFPYRDITSSNQPDLMVLTGGVQRYLFYRRVFSQRMDQTHFICKCPCPHENPMICLRISFTPPHFTPLHAIPPHLCFFLKKHPDDASVCRCVKFPPCPNMSSGVQHDAAWCSAVLRGAIWSTANEIHHFAYKMWCAPTSLAHKLEHFTFDITL